MKKFKINQEKIEQNIMAKKVFKYSYSPIKKQVIKF